MQLGGSIHVAGHYLNTVTKISGCGVGTTNELWKFDRLPEHLYLDGETFLPLYPDDYPDCRIMGIKCASACGGSLAVALTPKDENLRPYVSYKGTTEEYPVHGFISGISFQLPE